MEIERSSEQNGHVPLDEKRKLYKMQLIDKGYDFVDIFLPCLKKTFAICYKKVGPPGPLVVNFHSLLGSIAELDDVSNALANSGRQVLSIDLLGHGASYLSEEDISPFTFSKEVYFEQVYYTLEKLNLLAEVESLIGYSFGGALAVGFAHAYPNFDVRRIVLIGSIGVTGSRPFALNCLKYGCCLGALCSYGIPTLAKTIGNMTDMESLVRGSFYERGSRAASRAWEHLHLDIALNETRTAVFQTRLEFKHLFNTFYEARDIASRRDKLVGFPRVEFLLVWGEKDSISPFDPYGQRYYDAIEQARFVAAERQTSYKASFSTVGDPGDRFSELGQNIFNLGTPDKRGSMVTVDSQPSAAGSDSSPSRESHSSPMNALRESNLEAHNKDHKQDEGDDESTTTTENGNEKEVNRTHSGATEQSWIATLIDRLGDDYAEARETLKHLSVPLCGHAAHLEKPNVVLPEIVSFLGPLLGDSKGK